uniref:Uncharacterized protein n=1 Tax=Arundo donax TaxID=35708 RepID=A0A0A9B7J9_ARUDO
MSPICRPVKR